MSFARLLIVLTVVLSAAPPSLLLGDWPQFRGPRGAAVAEDRDLPAIWGDDLHLQWKARLPGFGSSSPVIVGDRVFLTCYSGYGLDAQNPGKEEDLKRHVLCLSRTRGELLWSREVPAAQPEASYLEFINNHGYATHTPASDGQRVYFFLGKSGVFCFELDGKPVWDAKVGSGFNAWGSSGSLILAGDLLLVNASLESYALQALDKHTGNVVWKAKNVISCWSTPLLVDVPGGQREIVLCVRGKLVGLSLAGGAPLWEFKSGQNYAAPMPAARDGVIYAVDSNPSRVVAFRAGGSGDVSSSAVAWSAGGMGSGLTSPLLYGDYLYSLDERGVLGCVEVATGQIAYRQRLDAGGARFYASPVGADGKVFAIARNGTAFVVAAGGKFEQLGVNRFAGDASVFNATPAISHGQVYLRSDQFLYCIGK